MSFIAYDLIFLLVFTLATIFFLYRRRSNLKRQGLLYLYHTRFGIKVIERISKQYAWILRPLQYVIITSGYLLMVVMVWMAVKLTYIYTKSPLFVQAVKIPPIIPLVPYLPELFKVDYLPPLYFTYWIVVIAIIAISHEFAHGIFARLNNIRVKSTGFGFLGPFLAAFVEPDEKQMSKASKFAQLSILGAGTFANVIMTLLFGLILAVFFMNSFTPAGVQFNSYTTTPLVVSSILTIAGMTPEAFLANTAVNNSLHEIIASNGTYLVPGSGLKSALEKEALQIIVYEDAPAVRAGLRGPIISVDSQPTHSITELSAAIKTHQPGDTVILVIGEEKIKEIINITLAERDGKAYLGIGVVNPSRGALTGWIYTFITFIKDPFIYYEPTWGGDFTWFIYYLLWWIVLINISVALMNMLPVGIFDGGRFFYLSVWGITKNEKFARRAFSFATWLFIALAIWLMVRWVIAFI